MRRRVLLIDLDPQGNATTGFGIDKAAIARGACEVLLGECTAAEAVLTLDPIGHTEAHSPLAVLPTNQDLTAAEVRMIGMASGREQRLRLALEPIRASYDLVLIDCPPALNMLTVNALVAADSVLIPMQCEYYALEGLSSLVATIEQIRATANPDLEIEGILRTMYDARNNLGSEVGAQLMLHFGDKVFRTSVPRNIKLAEAPSFGKPALAHDPDSRGALAYLALAGEMLRREEDARLAGPSMRAGGVGDAAAAPSMDR